MRKRFTKNEKVSFTEGTSVQWLNSTHWTTATITGELSTDSLGDVFYPLVYSGPTTRGISHGEKVPGYPGHMRIA